ncbi:MAG: efflux RND transporter permease subunit [Stenotrophobium sp.]
MLSLRYRIAKWVMRHRPLTWAVFVLITAFFAAGLHNVQLKTIFSDLLPKDDPFVHVFKDHPNFGNPLTVSIMVRCKNGDIFNAETLAKIWQMTRDIDLAPGVDHDQILSVATTKARYVEATPQGIDINPLMSDHPPKTPAEIEQFRERLDKSPGVRNFLVSGDYKSTLINATFIESRLDYGKTFDFIQNLKQKAADSNHEIYVAGQPMLIGWVYHYEDQELLIFGVTLLALVLALMLYMRNVVGVVTPIVMSTTAAIWGFGLVGWLKSPIEPLLMIVPLLLVARSFSHCVQFTERYYEIYVHVKDRVKAAEITMGVMMAPSVLGIFTDIVGIFLIALAPIPAMQRFALFCGFWAVWLIPTGVVLISLLLASMPAPKNVERMVGQNTQAGIHHLIARLLAGVASITFGKRARVTTAIMVVVGAFATYTAVQIKIGNPVEGSNLLWPDSEYNTAIRNIDKNFPGTNTLEVIFEGKKTGNPIRALHQADTISTELRLQNLIERMPNPPRATMSMGDYLMQGNRLYSGGDPRWMPLDTNDRATNAAANAIMFGSSAKDFSNVTDFNQENGTVSLWYKDNKQDTVDSALANARKAIAEVGADHKGFRIRLGSGTIALQQAMNNVVERYHYVILGLLDLVIFLGCSLAYRSFVAGIILLFPVNMTNVLLFSSMQVMGIGLDINSLMIATIGVGVGIDYGIYLLSRICEEYQSHNHDWGRTITASLTTTGKAILFTASIMLVGILPWYFLSGLKFLADMGLLLSLIMVINMVLSLVLLPLVVWLVKPKFVARKDLFVGEGVDLSQFTETDPPDGSAVTA